jgi:hypothetical protein
MSSTCFVPVESRAAVGVGMEVDVGALHLVRTIFSQLLTIYHATSAFAGKVVIIQII